VRLRLEREVLEPMGSARSSYHGGDYEGKSATNFLKKAKNIMSSTAMFLKNTSPSKRHEKCTDQMISEVCQLYGQLFEYYNTIRFLGRKRNGTATDEDIGKMNTILKLTFELETKMFDTLTPKMHGKWKRLQEDYARYRGCGDNGEDFVEQDHQQGKIDEEMTKGMRDRPRAFRLHNVMGETRSVVTLSGITEEMEEKSGRKKRKTNMDQEPEDMNQWVTEVSNLPVLLYHLGSVRNIINNNRRGIRIITTDEEEDSTTDEEEDSTTDEEEDR
jgi:hypothetical protein